MNRLCLLVMMMLATAGLNGCRGPAQSVGDKPTVRRSLPTSIRILNVGETIRRVATLLDRAPNNKTWRLLESTTVIGTLLATPIVEPAQLSFFVHDVRDSDGSSPLLYVVIRSGGSQATTLRAGHRLQISGELWTDGTLIELRAGPGNLRPLPRYVNQKKSEEERTRRRNHDLTLRKLI